MFLNSVSNTTNDAKVDGVVPYDLFLSETDPQLVKMQLDLAWATKGGADPVALFEKHPGRFPLWHVKDLDTERKTVLPVEPYSALN